jgi:hypothetical protein
MIFYVSGGRAEVCVEILEIHACLLVIVPKRPPGLMIPAEGQFRRVKS